MTVRRTYSHFIQLPDLGRTAQRDKTRDFGPKTEVSKVRLNKPTLANVSLVLPVSASARASIVNS